MVMEADS